ncbi:CxxxxCH/CxxCH domain-containing protein [candidate division KSB1 bacterium]|nr:CxxxxCH/CxxCH domain-containing protein [candidate division KSB1 bacterium]
MISKKICLVLIIIGLFVVLFTVCSKLKDQPTKPILQIPGSDVHQTDWLDTLSTNFHGKYIKGQSWDLTSCYKCHGKNYAGGSSGKSCNIEACHSGTPEACTTCHGGYNNSTGAPPKDINNNYGTRASGVGAHNAHLTKSKWGNSLDCSDCHLTPKKLNDEGHIDSDLPAEVVWGEFAKTGNLTPNYSDTTCSNVYCHGGSLSDGTMTSPKWNQQDSLTCDACHGLPPSSGAHDKHVTESQPNCEICHVGYLKNTEVNQDTHIDGKIDVELSATFGGSYANGICSNVSCHGSGNTPSWFTLGGTGCAWCHGGIDNNTGAPPYDLHGNTSTSSRGVGAHTAHVASPQWIEPLDCSECHIKPAQVNWPGHVDSDRPVEITWGDRSKTDGLSPEWDGTKCNNIYCHGNSLTDGNNQNPLWTDDQDLTCDACHGVAPNTGGHTSHTVDYRIECMICHDGYAKNSVNKQVHVNGNRDVQMFELGGGNYENETCSDVICHGSKQTPNWNSTADFICTSCHGGFENETGAPPNDIHGNTSKTATGVGAHSAHVDNPKWSRVFDCSDCHIRPSQISDETHIDGDFQAEITWGEFSKTGDLTPEWNGTNCENVYCHGATLPDGSDVKPEWTSTEDMSCDACHGMPPKTGAHEECVEESNLDCNVCHEGYSKNSEVNEILHLNGKIDVVFPEAIGGTYGNKICSNVICHGVKDTSPWDQDVELSCISCHGGTDNSTGAPPIDLKGNSLKTDGNVGAHTAHVGNPRWSRALYCDECHIKPTNISDQWHIDIFPPAEITWGDLAKSDQQTPNYDGTTCTNIYCHGSSLSDGENNNPNWRGTESMTCESCHGQPPETGAHEEHTEDGKFDCNICHDGYLKNSGVNVQYHINGNKDVRFNEAVGGTYSDGKCLNTACHGSSNPPSWTEDADFSCISCHGGMDNDSGAPPYDMSGNFATTAKGVGAHSIHITGDSLSDGMDCVQCHIKPHEVGDQDHIDANLLPAEITWGNLAKMDEATPSWDGVNTCSNVYCHGEFELGNKDNNPLWTQVDETQATCESCHMLPPPSPHLDNAQCSLCHGNIVDENRKIIDKSKHVNGQTDF